MKNRELYEKGLKIFAEIMVMLELEKSQKSELNSADYDRQAVKMNNITAIAEGKDYLAMGYLYDVESEALEIIETRRKEVFKNTSEHEEQMISLWKTFYETGDIKPLQDFHDRLL